MSHVCFYSRLVYSETMALSIELSTGITVPEVFVDSRSKSSHLKKQRNCQNHRFCIKRRVLRRHHHPEDEKKNLTIEAAKVEGLFLIKNAQRDSKTGAILKQRDIRNQHIEMRMTAQS